MSGKPSRTISLPATFLLFCMGLILLHTALLGYFHISEERADSRRQAAKTRQDYLESRQQLARDAVRSTLRMIQSRQESVGAALRNSSAQGAAPTTATLQALEERLVRREQAAVLEWVASIRFGGDGYVFVDDLRGVPLSNPDPAIVGRPPAQWKDVDGESVTRGELAAARRPEGGFFNYAWHRPGSRLPAEKTSFVQAEPRWGWIVGAGVYLDEVALEAASRQSTLDAQVARSIRTLLAFLLLGLGLSFLVTVLLSRRLGGEVRALTGYLRQAAGGTPLPPPDPPRIAEFRQIARSIHRMILAREETDQRLAESEATLRVLLNAIPEAALLMDADGRIRVANARMAERFDRPPGGLIDADYYRLFPPDRAHRHEAEVLQAIQSRTARSYTDQAGDLVTENLVVPVSDPRNPVTRLALLSLDITERRRAENITRILLDLVLKLSALSRLDEALEAIGDAATCIEGIDSVGVYLREQGSDAFVLFFHRGLDPRFIAAVRILPPDLPLVQTLLATQPAFEHFSVLAPILGMSPDIDPGLRAVGVIPVRFEDRVIGSLHVGSHRLDLLPQHDRNALENIATQIGGVLARLRMEENLRESEEKFRSIVEQSSDGIVLVDRQGTILEWNRALERITGLGRDRVLGLPAREVRQLLQVPDEALPDGLAPEPVPNSPPDSAAALAEWEFRAADGVLRHILESRFTLRTSRGVLSGNLLRDITEFRSLEDARALAERDLEVQRSLSIRADRLRSLGEMAAGIAHELNQPLVGVRGLAEHMLLALDRGWEMGPDTIRKRSALIIEQADRMAQIIEHVRRFSREADKPERTPVSVNTVVESALGMLEAQFRSHGLALEADLAPDLPAVLVNAFSLEEVVLNLLHNARDAVEERMARGPLPPGPHVRVATTPAPGAPGSGACLEIRDCGGGIPAELLEKVFDPFFTTKPVEKGTGLGLSISKTIIEDFGGVISIPHTSAAGTTVRILLPAAPA